MRGESVPTYKVDVAGIATSGGNPTFAAKSIVQVRPNSKVSVTFSDFISGNPERFYIDMVNLSSTPGTAGTLNTGQLALDRSFPFDVVFPSKFSRMSADSVRDLISYDSTKNVLTANLSAIYSRGFFDFDLILNMADRSTTPLRSAQSTPLLEISALPEAENHFSSASVRVERPENPDLHRVVISEDERVDSINLYDLETGGPETCDEKPYRLITDGFAIRSAAGNQTYTELSLTGSYRVPANFPLWSVEDGLTSNSFISSVNYPGATPRLKSEVRHVEYNFANSVFFYDQVVTRKLESSGGYSGNHPLIRVQDVFDAAVPHRDNTPMLQFRREFVPKETTSLSEQNRKDANFFLYLDPLFVNASDLSTSILNVFLAREAPSDLTCTMRWSVAGDRLLKNKQEIQVEVAAMWGAADGAKRRG